MRLIKLFAFIILVVFGFLFVGELSLLNLDTFQDRFSVTDFYLDNMGKRWVKPEMVKDMCYAGEKEW